MKRVDLLVIGRGVAGLTTALALSEAGLDCAVAETVAEADADDPADCALTALNPPWSLPAEVVQLAERSRRLYPNLVAGLGQSTGVDCELRRVGLIVVGEVSSTGLGWLAETEQSWQQGRLSDFEPGLAWGHSPAVRLSGVDQIRPSRLKRALDLALRQRGIPVLRGRPVRRLDVTGNVIRAVTLDNGARVNADAVILAAGSSINGLLLASGLDRLDETGPVVPHLRLNCGDGCVHQAVQTSDLALVPRADGRLLVSLAGLDLNGAGSSDLDELLTSLANWLPSLNRFNIEARWAGYPAGGCAQRPFIGAYPWIRGLWINAGHCLAGPSIAPAAAELLVDQLNGGPVPAGLAVRTRSQRTGPSSILTH